MAIPDPEKLELGPVYMNRACPMNCPGNIKSTWTTTKPTEACWRWYRKRIGAPKTIVYVEQPKMGQAFVYFLDGRREYLTELDGEWLPIEEPV